MSRNWLKYAALFGASLLTAGISLVFDEIRDEQRAEDIAEKAATKAVKKMKGEETEPHMNRAQRRAAERMKKRK